MQRRFITGLPVAIQFSFSCKLQFLRNIANIRLNKNTAPLCGWLGMNIAITTLLKCARDEEQRGKFHVDSTCL